MTPLQFLPDPSRLDQTTQPLSWAEDVRAVARKPDLASPSNRLWSGAQELLVLCLDYVAASRRDHTPQTFVPTLSILTACTFELSARAAAASTSARPRVLPGSGFSGVFRRHNLRSTTISPWMPSPGEIPHFLGNALQRLLH